MITIVHATKFNTPAVSRPLTTYTCIQERCTVIVHAASEDAKSLTAALQFASGSENAIHPGDWQSDTYMNTNCPYGMSSCGINGSFCSSCTDS